MPLRFLKYCIVKSAYYAYFGNINIMEYNQ